MDLAQLDAVAQAELVARGECSPAELVEAALERIQRVDPAINAVVIRRDDAARRDAAAAAEGPFRGVPILAKDACCTVAGDPNHNGMRFLRDRGWIADRDSYLARRLGGAGFVFAGRTNTPELELSVTTEPLAYGPTRNPWDVGFSPAGSSGGSGAAVAAGLAPVATSSDGGGSTRCPASACGLVGLKASRGRVSAGPEFGEHWGLFTHPGVLTRSVRDLAALLDVIAGYEPGDPYTAPPPVRPFREEVGADPGRLRIGLRTEPARADVGVDAECQHAVLVAGALLESLGHDVSVDSPAALAEQDRLGEFLTITASVVAHDLERWARRTEDPIGPDDVEPLTWAMAERGRATSAVELVGARQAVEARARRITGWWSDGFDILVTPTLGSPPVPVGVIGPGARDDEAQRLRYRLTQYTAPFNITGQPAISLPLHQTGDGLPVGVQFVAAYGRDDLLLRLAAQLETAAPWAPRRPAVHA